MDGFTLDELIGGAELAALGREGLCESSLLEALYFESIQNVVEEELRNDEIERIRNEPHELDYWGDAALQDFAADEVITNADVLAFHEYASQFVDEDGVLRRPTGDSLLNIVNINRFGEIEDYLFDLGLIDEISNPDELAEAEENYDNISTEEVFEIERELVLDHECPEGIYIRSIVGKYSEAVNGEADFTNRAALALYKEAKKYAIPTPFERPSRTKIPKAFRAKKFERLENYLFGIGLINNDVIANGIPITHEEILNKRIKVFEIHTTLVGVKGNTYTNRDLLRLYEKASPYFATEGEPLAQPGSPNVTSMLGSRRFLSMKKHLEREGLVQETAEERLLNKCVRLHYIGHKIVGVEGPNYTNRNLIDLYEKHLAGDKLHDRFGSGRVEQVRKHLQKTNLLQYVTST